MSEQSGIAWTLKDLPAPVDKILDFEQNGKKYSIVITDQVLITLPDGAIEMNVYGQLCKIIARIFDIKNKFLLKVESQMFEKSEVLSKWEETVKKIIDIDIDFFIRTSQGRSQIRYTLS